jgi:hypothetical protein
MIITYTLENTEGYGGEEPPLKKKHKINKYGKN